MALPMPREPPVTSAVLPARLLSMGGSFSCRPGGVSIRSLNPGRLELRDDPGGLDEVELREVALQVGVAFLLDAILVGALPLRSAFAVAGMKRFHDLDPLDHFPEGRESHRIE